MHTQDEDVATAHVAKRALAVVNDDKHVEAYYMGWHEAQSNPYDAVQNPGGCIQLGLSENTLSLDLLDDWFSTHSTAPALELENVLNFKAIAGYPDVYHGLLIFRNLMANFMNELYGGAVSFDPEKMVITTGATSAIEILAFCLADPGDVFLVPAPYYPGFERDIRFRSQVDLVPVPSFSSDGFAVTRAALEQAFEDAVSRGRKVKAVLMTSPSNPLGMTYSRDQLSVILDFIGQKDMHLICDEIYAGSVFGTTEFISIAELVMPPRVDPNRVHIIYGLSKVLGIPGFRVGLLYSWNSLVLDAAKKLTRFSSVPTLTQQILISLLSDTHFLRLFLSENLKRLQQRWRLVSHGLQEAGLEFVNCTAGFFCWVNIGKVASVQTKEQELELWSKLLHVEGLNVTPGSACQCSEPGWFRLCFAYVDDQTMSVALDRIKRFTASL
ncbi:protein MpACS [Marchantia polymorpha subsp. ruderalis]|uniref:Aminotransferase class I/classII large domain-containing protein n=2 Tax=Marchantia polymorpha TaxID=3197 RepID=A0AAF6BNH5_MARPO|nr:hypothetical protein MARPO_0034s0060 [Marchantia polymorpha]BBN13559.1 hypothetical protein Mp_6g04560 [Marchantia polymorpha subsp. ruderalis]|eukprot:PTQ41473.1 hypothetical protein MARPO_0034s0060 [Marchantia polymorpha]